MFAAALEEEIEACIEVCLREKVDADDTKEPSDYAYNQAINDCIASLKQRKGAR